jgi:hypothetical protein
MKPNTILEESTSFEQYQSSLNMYKDTKYEDMQRQIDLQAALIDNYGDESILDVSLDSVAMRHVERQESGDTSTLDTPDTPASTQRDINNDYYQSCTKDKYVSQTVAQHSGTKPSYGGEGITQLKDLRRSLQQSRRNRSQRVKIVAFCIISLICLSLIAVAIMGINGVFVIQSPVNTASVSTVSTSMSWGMSSSIQDVLGKNITINVGMLLVSLCVVAVVVLVILSSIVMFKLAYDRQSSNMTAMFVLFLLVPITIVFYVLGMLVRLNEQQGCAQEVE